MARETVSDQTDLRQGTLDLLVMRTIAVEPMPGWAIGQRIRQIPGELVRQKIDDTSPDPASPSPNLCYFGWMATLSVNVLLAPTPLTAT